MKKGGFLRNVLDTIRSNQANQQPGAGGSGSSAGSSGASQSEYAGLLKSQHFSLTQVARHGFPENPTALAFDPVQKIAAIGTKTGALRVFGRPGVDVWVQHTPEVAVTHIKFIINQGAIITVTADESINLWSLRGPDLKLTFTTAGLSGAHSPTPANAQHSSGGGPSPTSLAAAAELANCSDYLSCGIDQLDASLPQVPSAAGSSGGAPGATAEIQSRVPTILHTLRFQREHITCIHQTLMSKWLYIGTERGNVHVANVETFELSGYSIPWNKAIELSRKTHPGPIISISECPQDTNKLLIGYESGCIVLWDLKNRNAEGRYYHTEGLLWLAWHYEGKQFIAAHSDGSLVTWQTRSNARPAQILHPHAKTSQQQRAAAAASFALSEQQQQQIGNEQFVSSAYQQVPLAASATSFARALNNELYRPINKVEWKTSKASNEQFLLFSGGLPYDSLDIEPSTLQHNTNNWPPTSLGPQQCNQYLTATSGSTAASSMSPSLSPSSSPHDSSRPSSNSLQATRSPTHQSTTAASWSASATPAQLRDRRHLRATSLTVMFGKSITVLEMDDAIVDFVSVCDSSPYENDASDPYAVLVLLSNDLILIDLTSSGYPSFESPYPASALNQSPVTSIQYLADCSSDIIPMLYSTSRNVLSRAPKKGFSDKEWPINGGEWGQQMQSYPELVITGHADGTIKFWDMSGVNFDLISKIKTSKLFERPIKSPDHVIVSYDSYRQHQQQYQQQHQSLNKRRSHTTIKSVSPLAPTGSELESSENDLTGLVADLAQLPEIALEDCFAIEKIEYCSESRHLLVAGAMSQVIQFKLNKRDSSSPSGGVGAPPPQELTSLLVEPCMAPSGGSSFNDQSNQSQHHRTNLFLRARSNQQAGSTSLTSGGDSSSSASGALTNSGSHQGTNRTSGSALQPWTPFQPDMICLSPLTLMSSVASKFEKTAALSVPGNTTEPPGQLSTTDFYIAPPKVTALALKASHSILAYSHENGLVLIDNIQKCVVMNASLVELYGFGGGSLSNRCDISIQPFATSSILQQHYQSTTGTTSPLSSSTYTLSGAGGGASSGNNPPTVDEASKRPLSSHTSNNDVLDNGGMATQQQLQQQQHPKSVISGATDAESHDNRPASNSSIRAGSLHKSSGKPTDGSSGAVGQPNTGSDEETETAVGQLADSAHVALEACSAVEPEQAPWLNKEQGPTETGTLIQNDEEGAAPAADLVTEMSTAVCPKSRAGPGKAPPKLMHANSLDAASEPIAPPRAKKRQSVPTVRRKHEPLDVGESSSQCEAVVDEWELASGGVGQHEPSGRHTSTASTNSHQKIDDSSRVVATGASLSTTTNPQHTTTAGNQRRLLLESTTTTTTTTTSTLSSFLSRLMAPASRLAGGAFQRQLSTTALLAGGQRTAPGLFQRQMTASQLLSVAGQQCSQSRLGQQPARCAASRQHQTTGSALCLSGAGGVPAAGQQVRGSPRRAMDANPLLGQHDTDEQSAARKPSPSSSKNKRIISRMLSISAIHTHSSSAALTLSQGAEPGPPPAASDAPDSTVFVADPSPDKIDSSFTRSRSSSASSSAAGACQQASLEQGPSAGERVQCLCFLDLAPPTTSSAHKSLGAPPIEPQSSARQLLGLWLGTSSGALLLVGLQMPDTDDNRVLQLQSVLAEPIPQAAVKLRGPCLALASFGAQAHRLTPSGGSQSSSLEGDSRGPDSSMHQYPPKTQTFLAVVSEKEVRVHQVPGGTCAQNTQQANPRAKPAPADSLQATSGANCWLDWPLVQLLKSQPVARCQHSDSSFACSSQLLWWRQPEEACLASYLATGELRVLSLPQLRLLLEADLVPYSHPRIAHTMRFSRNGHCLYQAAPGQVCKFSLSAQYGALVNEMTGSLWVARDMPEQPRANFFKSLFSAAAPSRQAGRDELFGAQAAGKALRGVATHISSLDKLKGSLTSGGGLQAELRQAREGLDERGEKLSDLEDRTAQMANQAEGYAQAAHQLAQRFKDKKWYQF